MSNDRADYLRSLSEDQLRNIVLIPLLTQMGFTDVIEYHGSVEKGKDIICRFHDMVGEMRYVGVVVKRTDIHGAVGQAGSAGEVLLQIQQTFDEPYTDVFDLKEVAIDECWVVTSGIVKPSAIESVQGMLKKSNLNKLVRFIDQRKLCSLIDRHLPGFWRSDRYLMLILHELKGPIYSVREAAEFLNHIAGKEGDMNRAQIREIARDIELQMVLVARMLESNHLFTVSDLRVHPRESDLNAVAKHVIEQIQPFAERRHGQPMLVEFRKAPDHVSCEIDEHMISQAIWNLVDNALRYGDPQRSVIVGVENTDQLAEVSVTDFGIGIPPNAIEKIMHPHFRAENAMRISFAGAGLGLTVAERVARAHGGSIVVRSCANPTVIVLSLPKRREK